jgi:hypothetical protein
VPDRDYLAGAESEIADTTSLLTVVGGKVVYAAGDFAELDDKGAAARHAGLVAGAQLRRLRRLGRSQGCRPPVSGGAQARGGELRMPACLLRARPPGCGRSAS